MATWTDSRFKDFLRHPIGYLNGERERDIEALNDFIPEAPAYSEELTRDLLERKGDSRSQAEEATLAIDSDFGRTLAFVREGADIHYGVETCFDSVYNHANEDQRQAIVAVLPPQSRLNHAVTVKDIGEFKKALRQGADVFAEVPRGTAYEFRNGGRPDEESIKLRGPEAVLVSSVAEFVEQESRIIKEHDEQGLKQGIDPDRRQFAAQLSEAVNPLLEKKKHMEMSLQEHSPVIIRDSIKLFDGAHLSPEAADIYKASLSRNIQDTNDALDRIGGQAEPEQQAYNKQADPLDLKLDRAGEAAYQQTLRANGKSMTDSIATKTQADPAKLAAAWSSTQPTKENLEAVKPAQVAPSLTTGKRARF